MWCWLVLSEIVVTDRLLLGMIKDITVVVVILVKKKRI